MYYYLLHNNHTNTHDTIYAGSQEELQEAVSEVSKQPIENVWLIVIVSAVIIVLFILVLNKS
jgi:hypothetical protein